MNRLLQLSIATAASALLAVPAARAGDTPPAAAAPAATAPAPAAPAAAAPAPAAPAPATPAAEKKAAKGEDRAHVDQAVAFLNALAHSSRKGEQGEKAWAELAGHASDKVVVKIAGKEHDIDVAGKKTDVRLLKFAKMTTWREGKEIKGVALEVLELKVGDQALSGKARVSMVENKGTWMVDSITVE